MPPAHSVNEAAWAEFVAVHAVDDVLEGEVVSVLPFGAFVRIAGGVDGLAPQSTWPVLPANGARVSVRIAAIDAENRRVALDPA
jgi:small subunit ribosomal protein S1